MRKPFLFVVTVFLASFSAYAIGLAQNNQPQRMSAGAPTADEVMKTFRADMQANRTDLIAKNVTLSADQAAKFWPLYQKYQGEQSAIIDQQLKVVQQYVQSYETLDDATAMALLKAHFDRHTQMNTLRQKWLPLFQEVLPVKMAVRVLQIDRRLSLVQQMEISARIPLVH